MNITPSKKIVIVVDCLSGGGAEKAAGVLSNMLVEKQFHVIIISLKDEITYSYSGDLINLGENHSKFKRLKQIQKTVRLRKHIKKIQPDYILDFRTRSRVVMELLLHWLVWPSQKMIYLIQNYHVHWHLPKGRIFKKIYSKGKIVAVSKDIKILLESEYGFKNVTYIPNIIDFESIKALAEKEKPIEDNYIISIGRLRNDVKQHDKLIEAYSKTSLPKQGIKLFILGDGPYKDDLEQLIKELKMENHVKLLGFKDNPYTFLKQALFKVLCSKVEGFPLVLLESLALETPVISFNCKSGPSEMIINNENGLLIEDQNFDALQDAIENLATNTELLLSLTKKTRNSLKRYYKKGNFTLWKPLLK